MLNFFSELVWSPLGSRPHLLLSVDQRLADYVTELKSRARKWWGKSGDSRAWDEVVQEVPSHYLHITLVGTDQLLTSQVSQVEWSQLRDEAMRRLATLPPVEVRIGEPIVQRYALEVYVHPAPELAEVAAQARAAMHQVLGEQVVIGPPANKPYRPHLACFYGAAEFDSTGLQESLFDDVESHGHQVVHTMRAEAILTDQDTFHQDGFRWDPETAVRIPVGR